jgi:hypothetical protein
LVQLLAHESAVADPLSAVSRVTRLLAASEGLTRDTAHRLLKKVRKNGRFHLVIDAAAASGQLAVHAATMKLLAAGKNNDNKLLGI